MLVIIEPKKGKHASSAFSQMFSYLADARKDSGKLNCDVFGVVTDSKNFQFVVLRNNRRAYFSEPLRWMTNKNIVITFLDHILRRVIESSSHTTPVKIANKHIMRYGQHLRQTFEFGMSKEPDTKHDEDGEQLYNVVIVKGTSLLEKS